MKRKLVVNVPAGVHSGTQLRLSNEGEGGANGGPNGDLYVEMRVRADKRFEREEDHLIANFEVSYLQAALGAKLPFETLEGSEEVLIPRGSQPKDLIRLSGHGLPNLRSGRRGDLVLQLDVKIPEKLSKDEEKLLREIADLKKIDVAPESKGFFKK